MQKSGMNIRGSDVVLCGRPPYFLKQIPSLYLESIDGLHQLASEHHPPPSAPYPAPGSAWLPLPPSAQSSSYKALLRDFYIDARDPNSGLWGCIASTSPIISQP